MDLPCAGDSARVLPLAEPFWGAMREAFCLAGLESDAELLQGARSESLTSTGRFPIMTVALPLF